MCVAGNNFWLGPERVIAPARIYLPRKVCEGGGEFNILLISKQEKFLSCDWLARMLDIRPLGEGIWSQISV